MDDCRISLPWSQSEDDMLIGLVENGVASPVIARYLPGRSPADICARLGELSSVREARLTAEADRLREIADEKRQREENLIISRALSRDPRRAATLLHLLDLKRAGHSPTRTELSVPCEGTTGTAVRPQGERRSFYGSAAAMCAGF